MTKRFRKLALASAVALATTVAQAAPIQWVVGIDFETYIDPVSTVETDVHRVSGATSFPKGFAIFSGQYGPSIGFGGLSIYPIVSSGSGTGTPLPNPNPPSPPAASNDGYLSNDSDLAFIHIDPGLKIEHLAFDISFATAPGITLVGTKMCPTGDACKRVLPFGTGGWGDGWSLQEFGDLDADIGFLETIEFRTSLTFFAMDNLRLGVTGTGGGSVPEPSGITLVALSLALGGLVSRRRKPRV